MHNEETSSNIVELEGECTQRSGQYRLFEVELKDKQDKQQKLIAELENNLSLFDGSEFRDEVHFQYSAQTPVQRWYSYREGYSLKLVNKFLQELNINSNTFDPFVGSGTTLLASRRNGLRSFGIDINPISVQISKVKNERYNREDINIVNEEIANIESIERSEGDFEVAFPLAERVFNKEILESLIQFKNHIKGVENEKIRRLFYVGWLSIIEDVSNIKKEGNGIKYRNRKRTPTGYLNIDKEIWESQNFPSNKFLFVKNRLLDHLRVILYDLKFNYGNCEKKPQVFQGDCLEFDKFFTDEIEFTFFSPPYCNCFDYFEIHKVELWLGDFVKSQRDMSSLRKNGFRSNTNALNEKGLVYRNENIEKLIGLLDLDKLWSKKIPNVVRGYFDDFYSLLRKLYRQTSKKGYVGIVVGNSAYSGVVIPTDVLIAQIAKEVGFKNKGIFVTRHLTTSSQQKKQLEVLKEYLRESIVLLEK